MKTGSKARVDSQTVSLAGRAHRRAVFLDRDGTLNEERNYLIQEEDLEIIPGVPEAIRRLNDAGFLVIVVTNQSGVARGYFGLPDVEKLHAALCRKLADAGARIHGFYICPHHPTEGVGELRTNCDCRKGKPGLLLRAAEEHGIEMGASFMIGDKPSDIEAGEAAGCTSLLVKTGYGKETAEGLPPGRVKIFPNLSKAADFVLSEAAQGAKHA